MYIRKSCTNCGSTKWSWCDKRKTKKTDSKLCYCLLPFKDDREGSRKTYDKDEK